MFSFVGMTRVLVGKLLSMDATFAGEASEAPPELAITAPTITNSNSSRNRKPARDLNLLRFSIEDFSGPGFDPDIVAENSVRL